MSASGAPRPTRWYRGEALGVRAHVALRWATAPFGAVEGLLPASGRVLEWGCGHGLGCLHAAAAAPGRDVLGVDIDDEKLAVARRAAARAGLADRVRFESVEPDDLPAERWDAVVINDVLYLLDPAHQAELVRAAARAVGPGGVLVVKDMARTPRWKDVVTRAQERIVVGALGLTASAAGLHRSPPPAAVVTWAAEGGVTASVVRLDRGYHVPHVAVVGVRT
jgi:2-polyprenyl-3-methyl-5-hydroxy-6-metoxy-1,4-benzoquinol methylase